MLYRFIFLWLIAPSLVFAADAKIDWSVAIIPDNELFPTLDLSQAPHGSNNTAADAGNGLVRVRIASVDAPRTLRFSLMTAGLREPAVVETHIEQPNTPIEVRPRLNWDTASLSGLRAPRQQPLTITLESADLPPDVRTLNIRLHPLDEALYFVQDDNDSVDLGWIFAAYVNPNDPIVDRVLEKANSTGLSAYFGGYTSDETAVLRQVLAIWAALTQHGLRYANENPGISLGPHMFSQRVRLLSDVWDERAANCLDESVLIASVLERLGIRSFIVLVPKHAFVGFYLDATNTRAEFLETTLLGNPAKSITAWPNYLATSPTDPQYAPIIANFEAARRAGRVYYKRVAAKLNGRHRPHYTVIDIPTARSYGIMPLNADATSTMGQTVKTALNPP